MSQGGQPCRRVWGAEPPWLQTWPRRSIFIGKFVPFGTNSGLIPDYADLLMFIWDYSRLFGTIRDLVYLTLFLTICWLFEIIYRGAWLIQPFTIMYICNPAIWSLIITDFTDIHDLPKIKNSSLGECQELGAREPEAAFWFALRGKVLPPMKLVRCSIIEVHLNTHIQVWQWNWAGLRHSNIRLSNSDAQTW
jgi:hypothetical protein